MIDRRFGAARAVVAAACAFVWCANTAFAQSLVPAGESVHGTLASSDISTKSAHAGDGFILRVLPPYPAGDAGFAGAVVRGHVADVRSAGQGRRPDLKLAFDTVTFANGTTEPISGSVVNVARTQKENTTARKALGAGAGMAVGSQTIGRIIGGVAGGVVGLLGGAVAGFLYANNRKANFTIPKGTTVTMQLSSPVTVPRRQAGQ